MKLTFEVRADQEGGYGARAVGHSIFTQGENWEELRANVLEAKVLLHFEDRRGSATSGANTHAKDGPVESHLDQRAGVR